MDTDPGSSEGGQCEAVPSKDAGANVVVNMEEKEEAQCKSVQNESQAPGGSDDAYDASVEDIERCLAQFDPNDIPQSCKQNVRFVKSTARNGGKILTVWDLSFNEEKDLKFCRPLDDYHKENRIDEATLIAEQQKLAKQSAVKVEIKQEPEDEGASVSVAQPRPGAPKVRFAPKSGQLVKAKSVIKQEPDDDGAGGSATKPSSSAPKKGLAPKSDQLVKAKSDIKQEPDDEGAGGSPKKPRATCRVYALKNSRTKQYFRVRKVHSHRLHSTGIYYLVEWFNTVYYVSHIEAKFLISILECVDLQLKGYGIEYEAMAYNIEVHGIKLLRAILQLKLVDLYKCQHPDEKEVSTPTQQQPSTSGVKRSAEVRTVSYSLRPTKRSKLEPKENQVPEPSADSEEPAAAETSLESSVIEQFFNELYISKPIDEIDPQVEVGDEDQLMRDCLEYSGGVEFTNDEVYRMLESDDYIDEVGNDQDDKHE